MKIGVPKEIKTAEFRVALTPTGAARLVRSGHSVTVESSAGEGSGFSDDDYRSAGAAVEQDAARTWESAQLVLKVKEPLPQEFAYLERGGEDLTLFTYLHLAGVPGLAEELCRAGVTAIAYETVETSGGEFPLLAPMSEIAGKLAVHAGAQYLRRPLGTKGMLISGGPGIPPAKVAVIGAGVVGQSATRLAMAMGANVTLLNRSPGKLKQFLERGYPGSLSTSIASEESIAAAVRESDLVISGVYIAGAKATHVVTHEMVKTMAQGSVIVDVSIDQGGSVETSRPTTYENPVYTVDGVLHYCVANMPGAVPRTSTAALTNETLPYVLAIASKGISEAAAADPTLARGVNVFRGSIVSEAVAEATGIEYRSLADMMA